MPTQQQAGLLLLLIKTLLHNITGLCIPCQNQTAGTSKLGVSIYPPQQRLWQPILPLSWLGRPQATTSCLTPSARLKFFRYPISIDLCVGIGQVHIKTRVYWLHLHVCKCLSYTLKAQQVSFEASWRSFLRFLVSKSIMQPSLVEQLLCPTQTNQRLHSKTNEKRFLPPGAQLGRPMYQKQLIQVWAQHQRWATCILHMYLYILYMQEWIYKVRMYKIFWRRISFKLKHHLA